MNTQTFKTLLTIPLLAGTLFAQAPPKSQALLMAMQANGKQVAAYQWKQKTTILRKGSPVSFRIEQVRIDATGQPQRVTLAQPEEKKMGPLRAKKAAEIKDDIQDVMRLTARYTSPQQIAQAIQKGEVWEGRGTLRVQARSLILPIDEMTMVVNSATYLPTRIDFKTRHEGSPVAIAVDYEPLPGGPAMMMRMTVQMPEESLVVNVESFEFLRLSGTVPGV